MKRTLLLLSMLSVGLTSFAQRTTNPTKDIIVTSTESNWLAPLAKTTNTTDTIYGAISFNSAGGHLYIYGTAAKDSGYVTGLNVFGDKGYAQRYDFNGQDSGVKVLGARVFFAGKYASNTPKTVTIKCWSVGAPTVINSALPHEKYSGLPNAVLAQTNAISIKNLGMYTGGDTIKNYMFTSAATSTSIGSSFFVGAEFSAYSGTALAGDTLGVVSDSLRTIATAFVSGADTLLNDINAVESSTGVWDDYYFNTGNKIDFYIVPILLITNYNAGFAGVTKNNLTWYGNYPNPANTATNFKFALNVAADVTIEITDMSGRKIDVISQSNVDAGTHEITYNTSKLPAGNYMYMIHTSNGDAMASILSVVK